MQCTYCTSAKLVGKKPSSALHPPSYCISRALAIGESVYHSFHRKYMEALACCSRAAYLRREHHTRACLQTSKTTIAERNKVMIQWVMALSMFPMYLTLLDNQGT